MNIEQIHAFLGYCTLINIGLLIFSTIVLSLFKDKVVALHSKLFDVAKPEVKKLYLTFLANYKIAILILNLVPYLALCLID